MATIYKWSFTFDTKSSDNSITTIHWKYTAVDGEHSASMYGSCAGSDGMDFDSMTKEHCVTCVLENREQTEEEMKAGLDAQIEKQKNLETVSKTKEW
jgi:hypothetical protein